MPDAQNDVETVTLDGELVIDTVRRAQDRLVAGTTAAQITADLGGVTFIDSTGLRMLLDTKADLATQGRTLVLITPTSSVKLLLGATGTADELGVSLD